MNLLGLTGGWIPSNPRPMRYGHSQAKNLFSRLTSFIAVEGSNRIENLCTEGLAWSILMSAAFRGRFLSRIGFSGTECEVHTQHGYSQGGNRGCFDLVILSDDGVSDAAIIEVKVWADFGDRQPEKYREAIKSQYKSYSKWRLVSLTPLPGDITGFEQNIRWHEIIDILEEDSGEAGVNVILRQFADFLRNRGLGMVNLQQIDSKAAMELKRSTVLQTEWMALLSMLGNQPTIREIFKKGAERPLVEYDEEIGRAWIGIWSSGSESGARYYAGLGVMCSGQVMLWIELEATGDKSAAASRLPPDLQASFKRAGDCLLKGQDAHANLGLSSGEGYTYFAFARSLDEDLNGKPDKVLAWFREILITVSAWAKSGFPPSS